MKTHKQKPVFIDIPGIRAGHATRPDQPTGCTVVLCESGAVAGVDVRGSAPGTREVVLLQPGFMIRQIHAVVLSGGSAFGLAAADGVMRYLFEKNIGFSAPGATVPIVPSAVIFDLNEKRDPFLPDAQMGYDACLAALQPWQEGNVGAGTGARVGKILGLASSMPGGLATSVLEVRPGTYLGALAVVNAFGDIINPQNGKITAGVRDPQTGQFLDTVKILRESPASNESHRQNTTLAVIATNAGFSKEEINKIAAMAQTGVGRSTRPAHSMFDGDIVFALSTGQQPGDVNLFGELAAQLVSQAIIKAVTSDDLISG